MIQEYVCFFEENLKQINKAQFYADKDTPAQRLSSGSFLILYLLNNDFFCKTSRNQIQKVRIPI